ncbi:hypothetical protein NLI96_g4330 [Meripilus lineatus]|uniref:Uncharacterized protein n=1 Tax=Meripilus lineatus TaxID=2056292 RepID=A0AAD5V536_9APHY|nr:hypothetical protein NLI96_g4330 [Physisporinus lineatus]
MALTGGAASNSIYQGRKPNTMSRWMFFGIALGLFVLLIVVLSAFCLRNRLGRRVSFPEGTDLNANHARNARPRHKRLKVSGKRPVLHDIYLDRVHTDWASSKYDDKSIQSPWELPFEEKSFWRDLMPLTVSRAKRPKFRARSRSRSRPRSPRHPLRRPEAQIPTDVSPDNPEDVETFVSPPEAHSIFTNFPSHSTSNLVEQKSMHVAVLIAMPSAPARRPYTSHDSTRLPSVEIGCTHVPILSKKRRRDLSLGRVMTS